MILSNTAIRKEMEEGNILIDPFDKENLGPNSYDLHLSCNIVEAVGSDTRAGILYSDRPTDVANVMYVGSEVLLLPGSLYLGVTKEYTETRGNLVPCITGKSSVGRLGIRIHQTAGFGDAGFCGNWTLELDVVKPVTVCSGMPIAQIYWQRMEGEADPDYQGRKSSSYTSQGEMPVTSKLYKKLK